MNKTEKPEMKWFNGMDGLESKLEMEIKKKQMTEKSKKKKSWISNFQPFIFSFFQCDVKIKMCMVYDVPYLLNYEFY